MSTNPAARPFGTVRLALSFGVFVLVLLIAWVAVRAVGPADASLPPPVAMPSAVPVSESPTPLPPASPSPSSATPTSASPTPSASKSRTAKPTPPPEETRKPTTKPPAPKAAFQVTLNVTGSGPRRDGYMAVVRVSNTGEAAGPWRVTVSHADSDIQLQGVWNASGEQDGSRVVLSGGDLAPGDSTTFGYQVTKDGRGQVSPTGCSASRGSCEVR